MLDSRRIKLAERPVEESRVVKRDSQLDVGAASYAARMTDRQGEIKESSSELIVRVQPQITDRS